MTYFIGIDIAKFKHVCFIKDHNDEVIQNSFSFSNDKTGFNHFYSVINELDPNQQKRIGLEATGHYGMNLKVFLEDNNLSFMEINPVLINRFSKGSTLRKTKTDRTDATLIADYISKNIYVTYPQKHYLINSLKSLTRTRDSLIRQRSLQLVRITNVLDLIFPEFKPFFDNSLKSSTVLYLLRNYSSPSKMANMNSESYRKMVGKLKRTISYAKFCRLKVLAKNTIGSDDDYLVYQLQMLIYIYDFLDSKIKELEDNITQLYQCSNSHIHTIKGISIISAACIYSEYGGVNSFHNPNQMLAFAGLDPSKDESGQGGKSGFMVKRGSSYLRYILLNVSQMVIIHNSKLYEYYLKKRNQGKHHRVALSHVARKLIRIIFHLEKNNIDFNPNKVR